MMPDRKKLRVAFIDDDGLTGRLHFPSFVGNPDAEIVAVAHPGGEPSSETLEKLGLRTCDADYVAMIERERPDAVYVTVPPLGRYDIAATVLEMGCNLFVARPPALTCEQVRQMAALARKHRVLTGVAFYRRFSQFVRKSRRLCEQRGPVHTAVATFYKNTVGGGPIFRGGVDILTFDAIHAVDTLRYLCGGEVESVAGDVRRLGAEHHTAHLALVTFSSGATGVLLTNWMAGRRMFTIEVHGPGISCTGDIEEGGAAYADGKTEPVETLAPLESFPDREACARFGFTGTDIIRAGWHLDANRHFIDCIRKHRQPETNLEDALKTMELVEAVYRSQV